MLLHSAFRIPHSAIAMLLATAWLTASASEPPMTGPQTENRFPPLVVPEGFKATLFACDPLVEYPSAIALGPADKPASVFVAIDYMTGLGTEIIRRDEIRLIEDTNADGYADKATVYADGFNSIQGLAFHAGTAYAMHSPYLTALRDTDGDGRVDERRDLLKGLGLPPEENDVRLHCANGIVMGHDGWLYLALGDHGCDVQRPEGDRLVHEGGAILRCRADGRDLHVFARGLRNIYDVALDDELNVFVRDNENDGGDYKLRLCYSFFGADHGYPYLYYERPGEALPPLADLGLGSSAGGVAYLERQFPVEYHGSLLFCEWGRAVVRSHPRREGAGFAKLTESQFAAGGASDPYGFKPTDVVVLRDGSLVAADWCDGQRPKRGRGRIYRIEYVGADGDKSARLPQAEKPAELIEQLNSASYYERIEAQEALIQRGAEGLAFVEEALAARGRLNGHGRMHAVWILGRDGSPSSRDKLLALVDSDDEAAVRAQAVRAIADLFDPVLASHRLDARDGNAAIASRLAELALNQEPRVVREIIVALGRLKWPDLPQWLPSSLGKTPDPFLLHAAMQALRSSAGWSDTLKLLDGASSEPVRTAALAAIADQSVPDLADGLIARLADADAARRTEYAGALARIHRRPGPWKYWGYRPPPRPANSMAWERTTQIEQALDGLLRDFDPAVRLAVLERMEREDVPVRLATLAAWLTTERSEAAVAAILKSLPNEPAEQRREVLSGIITQREHADANRLAALELVERDRAMLDSEFLLDLARRIEDGPVLAELLRRLASHKERAAGELLVSKLGSAHAEVRAAGIEGLAVLDQHDAGPAIRRLLGDGDSAVRAAAAAAVGKLKVRAATEDLLQLVADADPLVRRACLDSLRQLGELKAVPLAVAALADPQTRPAALACLAELGGLDQSRQVIAAAQADPSEDAVRLTVAALSRWSNLPDAPASERALMEQATSALHGKNGMLLSWRATGPLSASEFTTELERLAAANSPRLGTPALAEGPDGRVTLAAGTAPEGTYLAYADLHLDEPASVQWMASASGPFSIWLSGQKIKERDATPATGEADRFDGALAKGASRIVVQVAAAAGEARFSLRFRRKSSQGELERLMQAALAGPGNADRGRQVFFDAKAQCSKCHRIGSQGEKIGPELTGIGLRFSRIHIVESILEPSRTVTPGFQTIAVRLTDGRAVSGVRLSETDTVLVLADQKGQQITLPKDDIQAQQTSPTSTMPDGLAQQMSVEQFRDLVAFLVNQQDSPAGGREE